TASIPLTASAASQVDKILEYAKNIADNNPHKYDTYCLKFCCDCYAYAGYSSYDADSAYEAGTLWIESTSSEDIPVGAMVFFGYQWSAYGHVGIYAGNGKMYDAESQYGGVMLRDFRTKDFRGWGWYGRVKPSGYISQPAQYTVSYNMNGGTGYISNQTKYSDKDLYLSSIKPTRSGYVFCNWNTKSNATGASFASGAKFTINANTTLYAVWRMYGDINKDNKANSSDALAVLEYIVSKRTFDSTQKLVADVNKDNRINSTDALNILNYTVGKIKKLG
ncbi:MAG: InlB B-repeat-containing protein, partial [Ruminococcus sp.]|nr:InlB B-repeat-containing protein [Candidatus Copronaster equi]